MKKVSIKDVASAAKVSVTTVSKALNNYPDISDKTKARIQKIVKEMNYVPSPDARSLAGKGKTTIAFILSEMNVEDASGIVFSVMSGVYHACKDNDCDFIVLATTPEEQRETTLSELCINRSVSGVVAFGFKTDDNYIEQFKELSVPVAVVDLDIDEDNIISVNVDNVEASRQAVEFLIDKGHKNIAFLNGRQKADVSVQRYSGYLSALQSAGIKTDSSCIQYCDFDENKAFTQALYILKTHPEVTAFFCASDSMAIGVCKALEKLSMVPGQEVDVMGFDDIPVSKYVFGGLSTVKQYHYAHGYEAGSNLIKRLKKLSYKRKVKIAFSLEIRVTAK